MWLCEICGKNESTRTVSETKVCDDCYTDLKEIGAGNTRIYAYYSQEISLSKATDNGKRLVRKLLAAKKKDQEGIVATEIAIRIQNGVEILERIEAKINQIGSDLHFIYVVFLVSFILAIIAVFISFLELIH